MTRLLIALLLVLSTLPASAQDVPELPIEVVEECGTLERNNTSEQYGNRQSPWLEYIVESIRAMKASCIASVRVDGNVQGAPGTSGTKSGTYAASLKKPVPVPNWGPWSTESHHFFTWISYVTKEFDLGWKKSTVDVKPATDPPPDDDGDDPDPDPTVYGECWDWECGASPLLLDMVHDGFHLTSLDDGVFFDIDGDGNLDQVAWTRADSDDAWLALDRNGNGKIDNGTELFGNHTPAYWGSNRLGTTANGFEALKFIEGPTYGTTGAWDEIIDAKDAVFSHLLLWTDRNHNGLSEPEELQPVGDAGLRAFSTDYKTARKRDGNGNEFRQRAKATCSEGDYFIYDVWLKRAR